MPRAPRQASIEPSEGSSQRALRAALVCLGLALAMAAVPLTMGNTGCATSPVLKGPGEPCTRTNECQSELTCTSGICRGEPGVDASVPADAAARSPDASASVDAGLEPSDAPIETDAPIEIDAPTETDAPIEIDAP